MNRFIFASLLAAYASTGVAENLINAEFEQVLTPTRLRQSIDDVPASVTIITYEMLDRVGVRSVPDALRLVPGMIVSQSSGHEWRISYHGTNGLAPRRMQVLVDGVSIYNTGMAEVNWTMLPVSVEDIERIEVTRSPSAAAYGANSFLGVVNIITRHPADQQNTVIKTRIGSLRTADAYLSAGTQYGSTAIRFSYAHQQDSGFDRNAMNRDRRDSSIIDRINLKTTTELDTRTSLDIHAAYVSANLLREYSDSRQISYPDETAENSLFSMALTRHHGSHRTQLRASGRRDYRERSWRSCYPTIMFSPELRALDRANPGYVSALIKGAVPTGGTPLDNELLLAVLTKLNQLGSSAFSPMCGDTSEDQLERQLNLELQDTWVINDRLRSVLGLSLRNDGYQSRTFVNGDVQYKTYQIFATTEYKPIDALTFNLSGMWEYAERRTEGADFSPRIALNYHFDRNNTLRIIYSSATRTPDALETDRDWNYYASNLNPLYDGKSTGLFYHNAHASGSLLPEKIISKEISYYMALPTLTADVKLFEEDLYRLISEKMQFFNYSPSNNSEATLRGAELQLEWKPTRRVSSWLAYGYIDNVTDTYYEKSLHARHSGSSVISYSWPGGWQANLGYYGNSMLGGLTAYGRTDMMVSKSIQTARNRLDFQLRLSKLDTTKNQFVVSSSYAVTNNYNDTYQIYGSMKLSFN